VLTAVGGGRFEVRGLAGEGGAGLVYRGIDREAGGAVAVKILRDGVSVGERFARESRLLAELEDPGIVRYVAHGITDGGQQYLVTEWLEGESLAHRLEARSLALEDTLRLGRRVAEILGRLHGRGIVHRDIKPSNLFLRGGAIERVTLIDFGIARYSAGAGDLTSTGTAVGTPGYMAPEQARGERDIDARADVFALGCVLFRCTTGRTPFRGDDALAVQLKIMLEEPPKMCELRPGLPAAFDELVTRMLSRRRDERPPHGAAVARELTRVPFVSLPAADGAREAEGLTAAEQQLVSVVAMRTGLEGRTLVGADTGRRDASMAELARRHGAQVVEGPDGQLVFAIAGTGAASDQAIRAARCALALRREHAEAAVAVTTGTGVVARGSALGEAVDRAIDLAQAAAAVRLDEVTAGLLPPEFETTAADEGIRLLREREQSEPIRTLLGRPTAFVGRKKELRILDAVLDECVSERVTRGALLIGPAGIGKSRVRYEFMRALERSRHDVQVWLGRGDPLLAGSAFGVLAQALRRQCGIRHGDPPEVRRAALRARIARSVARDRVELCAAFLGEMIGAPFSDQANPPLRAARESARLMNDRIGESWAELVAAECEAAAMVLIIEDLHWADPSSLRLVEEALALADRPLFLLGIARPEVDEQYPRLLAGRDLMRLVLSPLSRASSAELVRDVLGADVTQAAVDHICDRSAGNAFFLEELIRAESERTSGEELPSPGTVLAVVQARLEALELDARRVLRAASVFGQAFWRGAVDALIGDDSVDVDRQLAALAAGELIVRAVETRIQGQVQYAFRHVLVREAAYATLTDDDRIRGHRLAADWLERIGEAEGDADAAVLAEHHEKGGAPDRAAPWWKAAGQQAMSGADPDAAIAFADRAIACGAEGEILGEAELVRAAAFDWKGDVEPGEQAARRAVDALPPGSRPWCRAVVLRARLLLHHAHIDGVRALARQLLALAGDGAITVELASTAAIIAYLLRMSGVRGEDDALLALIESRSPPEVLGDPTVRGYLILNRVVLVQSNIATDLAARREAARCFEEAGDSIRAQYERCNVYFDLVQLGAYEEALRGFRALEEWSLRHGILALARTARGMIGDALLGLGKAGEALAAYTQIIDEQRRSNAPRREGGILFTRALAHLQLGALDEALADASRAVELLRAYSPHLLPVGLAVLALVELARGEPTAALAHARQAMSDAFDSLESGEMLVYRALVESLLAAGQREAAREVAVKARARLDELAGQIEDPALRQSFLAVDDSARVRALAGVLAGS
jgi:tetratricopeptide (TPR) repeat protein